MALGLLSAMGIRCCFAILSLPCAHGISDRDLAGSLRQPPLISMLLFADRGHGPGSLQLPGSCESQDGLVAPQRLQGHAA